MGNWRTVRIEGKVSEEQAADMIEWLTEDDKEIDWDNYVEHPIEYLRIHRSLFGIGQWVSEDGVIDCNGNLSAKSPTEEDVLRELGILAMRYNTLELFLHLGGDYEDDACVASYTVKNGKAIQHEPLVDKVDGVSEAVCNNRMFGFLTGKH